MKRLITFIVSISFLISCGSIKTTTQDTLLGLKQTGYTRIINTEQFDSLCRVDNLPSNLNSGEWVYTSFIDFETNENILEFMYTKKIGNHEIVYILIPRKNNSSYTLTKREIK